MKRFVKQFLIISSLLIFFLLLPTTHAMVDPLSVPNNKFGIHLISATIDESSPAASLVNSSGGDWGYVTIVIERKDKDQNKWQAFFNDLKERHLIPIVRIATESDRGYWKLPDEGEEIVWADFLDSLEWPTKNRYVVVYNEPNQAKEWGNVVDPVSYARTLDKIISALKNKNENFFVLNAGFDASAPSRFPLYEDEELFLKSMNEAVPGIFDRLDGWVSHSYPNPGFSGLPSDIGRGSIKTYSWELGLLSQLGLKKVLPVFITETGWRHSEGLQIDPRLPSSEKVSNYYNEAFNGAWIDTSIVAITPFLLTYQETPFDHFSFKKFGTNEYFPQYQIMAEIPKTAGKPILEEKKRETSLDFDSTLYQAQVSARPQVGQSSPAFLILLRRLLRIQG